MKSPLSFISFWILTIFCNFSYGQSCRVDIIALEAKIKAEPDSVLFALGDAIALRPDCLGELIEAAVKATEHKAGAISEIVKLAVSEYPDKAALIAESAVIASPDNVDVIRNAFQAAKNGTYKPKYVKGKLPEKPSPIESFLSTYETSKPRNPNDVANEALKAIDDILVKIQNEKLAVVGNHEEKAKALVAMPVVAPAEEKVETFRVRDLDEKSASTANTIIDSTLQDNVDELLTVEEPAPVIKDPDPGPNIAKVIKQKNAELEAKRLRRVELIKLKRAAEFSSSLYTIPAPKIANQKPNLVEAQPIVLRSRSASPTLPALRE